MRMDFETRQAAYIFLNRIFDRYDVEAAFFFGSRVESNYSTDSGADIAVVLNGSRGNFLDTKLALADIAYDVLLETGIHIHPLPVWKHEWEYPDTFINPELLNSIKREGVRL